MIGILYFLVFFFIALPCLVLLGGAVLYFVLGVKSLVTGSKEDNTVMTRGAVITICISLLGMLGSYFLFHWFVEEIFRWPF